MYQVVRLHATKRTLRGIFSTSSTSTHVCGVSGSPRRDPRGRNRCSSPHSKPPFRSNLPVQTFTTDAATQKSCVEIPNKGNQEQIPQQVTAKQGLPVPPLSLCPSNSLTASLGSTMLDTHRPGCRTHSLLDSKYLTASTFSGKRVGRPNFWDSKMSRASDGDPVDFKISCFSVVRFTGEKTKERQKRERSDKRQTR